MTPGTPLLLPEPSKSPPRGKVRGPLGALVRTRWGKSLLVALGVVAMAELGLPVPEVVSVLGYLALWLGGLYGAFRLLAYLSRRLLWRIRTKLILSYLFIAVVPVVLLALFFLTAGVLLSGLVGSHLVSAELAKKSQELLAVARLALASLPSDVQPSPAQIETHLAGGRAIHPDLAYLLAGRGRVLAASGDLPEHLPGWWVGPGFAGLVRAEGRERLRAVRAEADGFLILEVPADARLFEDLQRRTGIRLLTVGGRVERRDQGIEIRIGGDEGSEPPGGERSLQLSGVPFFATPERTDWATGQREPDPLTFEYQPYELLRRLTPGALNTADILVRVLAVLGVIFVVMYCFALVLGLLLARSITKSVHALSKGTERLRQGDFGLTIRVNSRDQLGELAESFNMMSRGIEDLLRERGEKERLEEELRIARRIQMSLLPQGAVSVPGLRVSALCLPAAEVGGDYYDLLPLSDTRMGVLVADVSGKGTSAALYMAELKGLVLSLSRIYDSPAKLLSEANRILSAHLDSRTFITMTYAVVDTETRTMRFARAGHNPLIHLEAATGRTRVLTPQGLGLGIDHGERFDRILEEVQLPLMKDDIFLFFTDGVSEAMNVSSELFGESRLRKIVEESEQLESEEIKDRILEDVRAFVGEAAQHDDMTMVILKVA